MRKCCLVIGHTIDSPGAVNAKSMLTEFEFNDGLSKLIEQRTHGVHVQRVYRDRPNEYHLLPGKINRQRPDFIISLHCNAFDKEVSGTEVLHWHSSGRGRMLAETLQQFLVSALDLPDRGVKMRHRGDRGAPVLERTKAPCVIAEPFFIDNNDDLARARERIDELASAYAAAIEDFARCTSVR